MYVFYRTKRMYGHVFASSTRAKRQTVQIIFPFQLSSIMPLTSMHRLCPTSTALTARTRNRRNEHQPRVLEIVQTSIDTIWHTLKIPQCQEVSGGPSHPSYALQTYRTSVKRRHAAVCCGVPEYHTARAVSHQEVGTTIRVMPVEIFSRRRYYMVEKAKQRRETSSQYI